MSGKIQPSNKNRLMISDLNPGMTNTRVLGLILKKNQIREFNDKKCGQLKESFKVIIRDETSIASVTCWDQATSLYALFSVSITCFKC